jgi:hypothetical protein
VRQPIYDRCWHDYGGTIVKNLTSDLTGGRDVIEGCPLVRTARWGSGTAIAVVLSAAEARVT